METEHIEKFIKDAIEGGWKNSGFLKTRNITVKKGGFTLKYANEEWDGTEKWAEFLKVEEALLDPNAWRAVGKTRNWLPADCPLRHAYHGFECEKWREKMLNFVQHLQDGKSINQALEAINN